jgi:hypothetical protein
MSNYYLRDAAGKGDLRRMVQLLRSGAEVNSGSTEARDRFDSPDGHTALMTACGSGQSKAAQLLCDYKADLDIQDKQGWSAAVHAVYGKNPDCLAVLIASKADVEKSATNGWSPLMWSAFKGCSGSCKLLIDAGADILKTDKSARTPLTLAREKYRDSKGHQECVQLLRQAEEGMVRQRKEAKDKQVLETTKTRFWKETEYKGEITREQVKYVYVVMQTFVEDAEGHPGDMEAECKGIYTKNEFATSMAEACYSKFTDGGKWSRLTTRLHDLIRIECFGAGHKLVVWVEKQVLAM